MAKEQFDDERVNIWSNKRKNIHCICGTEPESGHFVFLVPRVTYTICLLMDHHNGAVRMWHV